MRFNTQKAAMHKNSYIGVLPFLNTANSRERLLKLIDRYKVDFDVYLSSKGFNLQRPYVWSLKQKQELIYSILRGVELPLLAAVNLTDDNGDNSEYLIIDGKQRLSSIFDFTKDKFSIKDLNGDDVFFSQFTTEEQFYFGQSLGKIRVQIAQLSHSEITDDALIEWFKFLNFAGTPQDEEHFNRLKKIKT